MQKRGSWLSSREAGALSIGLAPVALTTQLCKGCALLVSEDLNMKAWVGMGSGAPELRAFRGWYGQVSHRPHGHGTQQAVPSPSTLVHQSPWNTRRLALLVLLWFSANLRAYFFQEVCRVKGLL